jgi:hypothetical protein
MDITGREIESRQGVRFYKYEKWVKQVFLDCAQIFSPTSYSSQTLSSALLRCSARETWQDFLNFFFTENNFPHTGTETSRQQVDKIVRVKPNYIHTYIGLNNDLQRQRCKKITTPHFEKKISRL